MFLCSRQLVCRDNEGRGFSLGPQHFSKVYLKSPPPLLKLLPTWVCQILNSSHTVWRGHVRLRKNPCALHSKTSAGDPANQILLISSPLFDGEYYIFDRYMYLRILVQRLNIRIWSDWHRCNCVVWNVGNKIFILPKCWNIRNTLHLCVRPFNRGNET